jgi:hypothetical protein
MSERDHDEACACCEGGRDAFLSQEDERIARFGYTYTSVFGSAEAPGFMYTTGLSERGMPDVIFVGSHDPRCIGYLSGAVDHMVAGGTVEPGRIEPGQSFNGFEVPIFVIEAKDKIATHAYGVPARLERVGSGAEPRLLQIVMPDLQGRFPWEDGYQWLEQLVDDPTGQPIASDPR